MRLSVYKAEKIKRVSSEISQEEIARILNIPEKLLENVYEVGDTSFIKSLEYEAYADGELNFSNLIGIEDSNFLMIEDNNGYFSNAGVANGKTHFEKIEKSLF